MAKMYNGQVVSEMVISAIMIFLFFLIKKYMKTKGGEFFLGFIVKEENRRSVEFLQKSGTV
jgi:hypothetical protein